MTELDFLLHRLLSVFMEKVIFFWNISWASWSSFPHNFHKIINTESHLLAPQNIVAKLICIVCSKAYLLVCWVEKVITDLDLHYFRKKWVKLNPQIFMFSCEIGVYLWDITIEKGSFWILKMIMGTHVFCQLLPGY